jgi:hypothetical protein
LPLENKTAVESFPTQPLFVFFGDDAVPKPRARDVVSGLSDPLALAGTLCALFVGRKGNGCEAIMSAGNELVVQREFFLAGFLSLQMIVKAEASSRHEPRVNFKAC